MNDVLNEQLMMMDTYFERMLNCTSTNGRRYNYDKMIDIYYTNEVEISKYWKLDEKVSRYCDRFTKLDNLSNYINDLLRDEIPQVKERFSCEYLKNEQLQNAPTESGVYLIGSVHVNPITNEPYYWIKVGKAKSLYNRLSNYMTHNPMMWLVDTRLCDYECLDVVENYYHSWLDSISATKGYMSKEWWVVSRETYLEICQKGFDYFKK